MPTGKSLVNLGYEIFLAFFLWSGLGQLGVVLAQASLTGVAAYCLYRLARRLYDHKTGLLATFFYIAYADIHFWNYYILTNSLYTSMVIISLFLVVERKGWWWIFLACFIVTFTSSLRLHGVVLLMSVGLYILSSLWRSRRYMALAGLAGLFLVASVVAMELVPSVVDLNLVGVYAEGRVIDAFEDGYLKMPGAFPESLDLVNNPFAKIPYFIAEKPVYFLKLASMKLWYLFLHVRPYYSDFHNYFLVLTLVPSYILAVLGLISPTDYPADKNLLLSFCVFQSIVVVLTFADWDGRYLVVMLPIIFIFSARGAWGALGAAKALMDEN